MSSPGRVSSSGSSTCRSASAAASSPPCSQPARAPRQSQTSWRLSSRHRPGSQLSDSRHPRRLRRAAGLRVRNAASWRRKHTIVVVAISPLVDRYDHVVVDMDGCLWIGDELTARAGDAVAAIREAGKGLAFVTNNPRRSAEDYVAKMWRLGMQASPSDVVTVGGATQHLLAETRTGRTAFVVGSETLRKHVADAGLKVLNDTDLATRAEVVVIGGTDEWSSYDVRVAAMAARRNGDIVATSLDPTYPM